MASAPEVEAEAAGVEAGDMGMVAAEAEAVSEVRWRFDEQNQLLPS